MLREARDERLPLSARFEYHCVLRYHQLVFVSTKIRAFVFVICATVYAIINMGLIWTVISILPYLAAAVQR